MLTETAEGQWRQVVERSWADEQYKQAVMADRHLREVRQRPWRAELARIPRLVPPVPRVGGHGDRVLARVEEQHGLRRGLAGIERDLEDRGRGADREIRARARGGEPDHEGHGEEHESGSQEAHRRHHFTVS